MITESALMPAQTAFDALLVDGHNASVAIFAERLRSAWPQVPTSVRTTHFKSKVHRFLTRSLGSSRANRWADTAAAMAAGHWDQVVPLLIEINAATMLQRGGAPWVRTGHDAILDVRLPVGAPLPDESQVLEGWRNAYLPRSARRTPRPATESVHEVVELAFSPIDLR